MGSAATNMEWMIQSQQPPLPSIAVGAPVLWSFFCIWSSIRLRMSVVTSEPLLHISSWHSDRKGPFAWHSQNKPCILKRTWMDANYDECCRTLLHKILEWVWIRITPLWAFHDQVVYVRACYRYERSRQKVLGSPCWPLFLPPFYMRRHRSVYKKDTGIAVGNVRINGTDIEQVRVRV